MPKIPEVVKVVNEMIGGVNIMKYSDHDVEDTIKFLDLAQHNYMESRGEVPSSVPLLEPTQWILGIYNIGIMNLLDISHFGRGKNINACVKQLLSRVHGGVLWMDRPVPINVDLAVITRLPTWMGRSHNNIWRIKLRKRSSLIEIKEKYGTDRGNRGIMINDINDPAMRFSTRLSRVKINVQM
jgi:hypothetical protein